MATPKKTVRDVMTTKYPVKVNYMGKPAGEFTMQKAYQPKRNYVSKVVK